jgi:CubicO group peptidase (beta-lactamase class C family)
VRILKRVLAGLLVLVVASLAAMYVADPVIATRLVGLPFGGGTGPEERVAGGTPAELPVAAADKRSISDEALQAAIDYGAGTGSHALLVWHEDALQLEHYYPGYDQGTRTSTQSMHKSVLALLVGIAIRDGFIASVDDPAARYLPEWAGDGRAKITIRQMLGQQSGIGFPTVGFNPVGGFFQLTLGGNIGPIALGQRLEDEPGTRFDYNSINPAALGIILERATGKRYAQDLTDSLWARIGATDAVVILDSDEHRVPRFFCCLNATARSWLQVGRLHLTGGVWGGEQVVPAAWMREVVMPSPQNPNYGFFTWLGNEYQEHRYYNHKTRTSADSSEPFAAKDVVYFDGFGGQRVYVVPSLGLVIVRTGALATDWDDARLPNLIIRGIR